MKFDRSHAPKQSLTLTVQSYWPDGPLATSASSTITLPDEALPRPERGAPGASVANQPNARSYRYRRFRRDLDNTRENEAYDAASRLHEHANDDSEESRNLWHHLSS